MKMRQNGRLQQMLAWLDHGTGVIFALALAGCSHQSMDVEDKVVDNSIRAAEALEEFSQYGVDQGSNPDGNPSTWSTGIQSNEIPERFLHPDSVYMVSSTELSLLDLLYRLEDLTGIPHAYFSGTDQVMISVRKGVESPAVDYHSDMTDNLVRRPQVYSGPLDKVLDSVASQYNIEWNYTGKRMEIREYTTRIYHLPLLPKQFSSTNALGSVNISTSLDPSREILNVIEQMAGPDTQIAYSAGTGILLVKARPSEQRSIGLHIGMIERDLERQMAFDVHVLTVSVTRSRGSAAKFDMNLLGNAGQITWSGNSSLVSSSDTVNVGIARDDFKLDLLISALNRHGKVAVETRTGATTSNNQLVPIQVVREIAYVKQVNAAPDADGNLLTSIEPGSLTTGFEMNLLPRVLDGNRVLLNYSIKVSELNRLDKFTTDLHSIQLPSVSTTAFEQQAILGDGETLVLAGFERDSSTNDNGKSILFANKNSASIDHMATVILIRSRILGNRLQGKVSETS